MDTHFKMKWVEALRSGDFQQCREELSDGFGFCCIGVGYAVKGLDCNVLADDEDPTEVAAKVIGLLPEVSKKLVRMNDDERRSFEQIADYIEREL